MQISLSVSIEKQQQEPDHRLVLSWAAAVAVVVVAFFLSLSRLAGWLWPKASVNSDSDFSTSRYGITVPQHSDSYLENFAGAVAAAAKVFRRPVSANVLPVFHESRPNISDLLRTFLLLLLIMLHSFAVRVGSCVGTWTPFPPFLSISSSSFFYSILFYFIRGQICYQRYLICSPPPPPSPSSP